MQDHLRGREPGMGRTPKAAGAWGRSWEIGSMVSLGSTETSVLGQPKGTVRGPLSKGDPAAGHRCFPSLGCILETWREESPSWYIFITSD